MWIERTRLREVDSTLEAGNPADATFEKGPATLRIRTVRQGAEWKLLEFFVHSEALLR